MKLVKLSQEVVIRTLQKAVRDTNDLYLDVYANEQLGQHSAALSTIMRVSGLLLARFGFNYTSSEHNKAIKRIWSVDRRRVFFEEWMKRENKGSKKPFVQTPSPYDLAGLKKEHAKQKGKKPRG